jgi:molybdopterin synthase catalytic subunit
MCVLLKETAFDPYEELRQFQRETFASPGAFGATASFVGTMRDLNEGDAVLGMFLEHYPGMTERHLQKICESAQQRWELQATLVVHRVGEIAPGDPIVLVAVWSAHRAEAFEACRAIMEDLKSAAPFWKKETLREGTRWVGRNTSGTARLRSSASEEI